MILETTTKYRADTEISAKDMIEAFRKEAQEKGYTIKKAGYEYKTKKAKGEIIAEAWVVTITQVFGDLWEDLV
jgi:hypothetical protein